jgi:hypothetical protein
MAESCVMRPLPNINDDTAMILRGKRSVIASARNEAAEALRDATVLAQSCGWDDLALHASQASMAADRLKTLAAMWEELA